MVDFNNRLRFSYKPQYSIIKFCLFWVLFSVVTVCSFGFLYPWMRVWVNRYFFCGIRVNNQPLKYIGSGSQTIRFYIKTNLTYILLLASAYTGYIVSDQFAFLFYPNLIIHGILCMMHYHYSTIRYKAYQLRHLVLDEPLTWRGSYWVYTKQMTRAMCLSILSLGYFYPDYLLLKYTYMMRHLAYKSDIFHFEYDQNEWDVTLFDNTAISFLTFGFYKLYAHISVLLSLLTHVRWERYKSRDLKPYPPKEVSAFFISFFNILTLGGLFPIYMHKKFQLLFNQHRLEFHR